MSRRQPRANPFARPLAVVAFSTLGIVGAAALFGWDRMFSLVAKPLVFVCAVLVILYTIWAVRIGQIMSIGHVGERYQYRRKDEPILFFLLVAFYLFMAVPAAWYTLILMARGLSTG